MKNRLTLVCCGAILIISGTIWYLYLSPPVRTIHLQPLFIKGVRIFSHQWTLPESRIFMIPSDDLRHPRRSSLRVFEDGKELGPAHSLHTGVATKGRGRFSHWKGKLIFSASDNTNPRFNKKRYVVRVRPVPRNWVLGVGLGGVLAVLGWAWAVFRRARVAPDRTED